MIVTDQVQLLSETSEVFFHRYGRLFVHDKAQFHVRQLVTHRLSLFHIVMEDGVLAIKLRISIVDELE